MICKYKYNFQFIEKLKLIKERNGHMYRRFNR